MTVEMRGGQYGVGAGPRSVRAAGVPAGVSVGRGASAAGAGWDRRSKHRDPPTTDSEDNSDSPGNTTTKGDNITPAYGFFYIILESLQVKYFCCIKKNTPFFDQEAYSSSF